MDDSTLYMRKASLVLSGRLGNNPSAFDPTAGIDLSEAHFTFQTSQADVPSPSNCAVRVYNLSQATVRQIRGEYTRVTVQAGYEGSYGVIFDGTIKQYRIGRENATDTYLDILAADGDLAYTQGFVNRTLAAGSKPEDRAAAAVEGMKPYGAVGGYTMSMTGGILPRGKVLFAMSRAILKQVAQSQGATWSIQDGKVNILPLKGYLPGEAVVLTAQTGLIGIPEQTVDGMNARTLLNPKLIVGGTVRIDNASINQTVRQNPSSAPVAYNQWTGLQQFASIANDGLYRIFVVEHIGDTRGPNWYTNLVCLAVDPVSQEVKSNG